MEVDGGDDNNKWSFQSSLDIVLNISIMMHAKEKKLLMFGKT